MRPPRRLAVPAGLLIAGGLAADTTSASLAALGMPGCSNWLGALDLGLAATGASATVTIPFALPAGVPPGARLHAMAVALTQPGAANAFGAVTSNGVASFVNAF
jgi:hypothetical protein